MIKTVELYDLVHMTIIKDGEVVADLNISGIKGAFDTDKIHVTSVCDPRDPYNINRITLEV